MIEVRLFANFRDGREKIMEMALENYPTPLAVIGALSIDEKEVAICLINGWHNGLDTPLKDGDVLSLFPPAGGG